MALVKSQKSTLLSYFSVVVRLRWLYYHMLSVSYIYIYIPGKLGFVSFVTVQSYDVHT